MQPRSSAPSPAPPSPYRLWLAVAAVGGPAARPPSDDRVGGDGAQAGPVAASGADAVSARTTEPR
jgi:hypothetical protein